MSDKRQQQQQEEEEYIVMLPFMAQGHFIPFLSLARLILRLKPHCSITIATTPLNIPSLRSSLPLSSPIHLAPLPFSSSLHGLPPDTENTSSLPRIDSLPLLMLASETLAPAFDLLLSDLTSLHHLRPPLLLIADVFASWSLPIARQRRIPHFSFSTSGAFGTAAFTSLWLHLPHLLLSPSDSSTFPVPGFPDRFRLHRSQMSHYMRSADGTDDWSLFLRRQIRLFLNSDALLCSTVAEIEPFGVELLRRVTALRVFPVGTRREAEAEAEAEGKRNHPCMQWLETQAPASVLYVSFGSQNTIGEAQMMALAEGLEASGVRFVWVVRPPHGYDMSGEFDAERWLPEGFEARMGEEGRGLVVRKWAPQMEILSHEATGGFLSHCGWNSVMESLSRGVPVIGWPVASEQFYNSMMMEEEEMGVGVEMARGVMGEVDKGKVERVVRMVMAGEKGREMRERAVRCGEIIGLAEKEGGSSVRAVEELFEAAMELGRKLGGDGGRVMEKIG